MVLAESASTEQRKNADFQVDFISHSKLIVASRTRRRYGTLPSVILQTLDSKERLFIFLDKECMKIRKSAAALALCTATFLGAIPSFAEDGNAAAALSSHGVGPVKSVALADIDAGLADKGKAAFAAKCSACHKLGERYVGPDLAGVTKRRSPEWIMNMILNPQEMTQKDPIAQELFGEYLVQMTFQNVSEPDTRAILEYFRQHDK